MDKKILNVLYYIFLALAVLIGLLFAGCIIFVFIKMVVYEGKNTFIIIGSFLLFLLMVYLIKRVRNEL